MKKLFLAFLTVSLLITMGASAQIVDDAPQDALYEDNELLDKKPIPYPTVRQADVMWSKRVWREIDFRQKFNQKFYFPTETQANWKSFIVVVLEVMERSPEMP